MNEDVTQIIEELTKLYDDGKSVIAKFEHAYNTLVPDRHELFAERLQMNHYGMLERIKPAPKPQHFQMDEIATKAVNYAATWTQSVNDLLAKVPQTRFRLQFNDPNQKYAMMAKLGKKTPAEEGLFDITYNLASRHAELRQIIIELEQTTEQAPATDTKYIAPATYDKQTSTLSFAGKDIRFKNNAPFTPALCDVIFSQPDKLWLLKDLQKVWDSQYDYLPERIADWHRVYEAINRVNMRIYKQTDIDNLFVLSTTSVRLNGAYLSDAKKSQ